jgi:hypothetical protein
VKPLLSLWKVERLSRSTHRSEIRVEEQNGARVSKRDPISKPSDAAQLFIEEGSRGSNQMNESVTSLEKAINNPFFHLVDFIVAPSQACLTLISALLALWQLQRQSIAL